MNTRVVMLVASLFVALPMLAVAQPSDEAAVPRMSLQAFKRGLDSGTVLAVDVRDADSYGFGHIPGAILVPFEDVARRAAELNATKKILVTYCG